MSFNNRPQSWRQNCGCLNNIKVCHSWWGYLGLFKVSFLNIAQVIPETRFWFCDWYWGVSLWAGKFGTLEYSRMNVTFHNIGGVILIFCYFFSDYINIFQKHLVFFSARDQIWLCDWHWGVLLQARCFRVLEYTRMTVPFLIIGGVILIFWKYF